MLCFVPAPSGACERVLEERRVRGTFSQVTSLQVRLLPLDADLLSMEYPLGFKVRIGDKPISTGWGSVGGRTGWQMDPAAMA